MNILPAGKPTGNLLKSLSVSVYEECESFSQSQFSTQWVNSLVFLDSWIAGPNPGGTSGRFALERCRLVLIVEGNGMVVWLNNKSYGNYLIVAQIS